MKVQAEFNLCRAISLGKLVVVLTHGSGSCGMSVCFSRCLLSTHVCVIALFTGLHCTVQPLATILQWFASW